MAAGRKAWQCVSCGRKPLTRNEKGICRKLLGEDEDMRYCLDCLAEYLEVPRRVLEAKIEEFRDQGCSLFKDAGKQ